MSPTTRHLVSAAQLLLVGGGVIWLLVLAQRHAVVSISGADPWLLLTAFVVNMVALCLMASRFAWVARAARLSLPVGRALRLHFQSVFYLFVLPFGVGMEAARFYGLAGQFPTATRRTLLTVVVADRVLGLLSAIGFAAIAGAYHFGWHLPAVGLGIISLAGAALVIARQVFGLQLQALLQSLALSLTVHGLILLAVVLLCASVQLDVTALAVVLSLSLAILASVVPTTFAGAGAGDLAAAGLLVGLGLTPLKAATIAGFSYLGRLLGAITGALLELGQRSLMINAIRDLPGGK